MNGLQVDNLGVFNMNQYKSKRGGKLRNSCMRCVKEMFILFTSQVLSLVKGKTMGDIYEDLSWWTSRKELDF